MVQGPESSVQCNALLTADDCLLVLRAACSSLDSGPCTPDHRVLSADNDLLVPTTVRRVLHFVSVLH